jgi:hypothetical protein
MESPRLDSDFAIDYLGASISADDVASHLKWMRADDFPYIDIRSARGASKYLLDYEEGSHGYGNCEMV